jgi:hypothetical protein
VWHHRLGHPSATIVQQVLSSHQIPFVKDLNNHVCDACQQGKSHQLPYPKSTSVSSSPLDLIFFRCLRTCPDLCWSIFLLCQFH